MSAFELTLREKILLTRLRTGETQEEFGDRFGVSDQTVRDWEAGTMPRRNNMNVLSQLFADYLTEVEPPETVVEELSPPIQLQLPFAPLNVAVKLGPATAESMHVEIRFERKTG